MSVLKKLEEFDKDGGVYKYVKFADGRVLFCDGASTLASHIQIVNERAKEVPVAPMSAGMISVLRGRWRICDGGSVTARLPRGKDDEDYIETELGEGFKWDSGI